jgi:aryl-alcohol dehydrogenase-like predicted oxidoreductase
MNQDNATSPQLSRLGLGTGTLGTLGKSASPSEVRQVLTTMLEQGITVIDTADTYGSGHAEVLLGKALKGRRERFFLMTKAGYRHGSLPWPLSLLNPFIKKAYERLGHRQCFDVAYLRSSLKKSLSRLKVNHVDVFFLHDPGLEDLAALPDLHDLVRQGLVGQLGVSSFEPKVIAAALASGLVGVIQTPANFKDAHIFRDLWQQAAAAGVMVVANHIMGPGNFGIGELTREIMLRGTSALLPEKSVLLCGTRNPAHLAQSHGWALQPLSEAEALHWMKRVNGIAQS